MSAGAARRRATTGALHGALATLPMSALMLAAQRAGLLGRMPPAKIADAGLAAAGAHETPTPARRVAAAALHLGFGAAAGAFYAWWSGRGPGRTGPLQGMAFGTLVWLGSYAGWIPALGILPPPHRDRRARPSTMVLDHWIYGGVLGAALRRAEA